MYLELFPLTESKNLDTHRLLRPFSTQRDVLHDFHRRFIGVEQWRLKKANIQTIALRSFKLQQKKFEQELTKIIHYLQHNFYTPDEARSLSKKVFYKYYKQAYFLGLKSSGAGISQSYSQLLFKDSSDPRVYQEEERWSQTAATAELKFWGRFLNDVSTGRSFRISMDKRIKMYATSLEGHYNAGRVAGSPNHSIVHWTLDKGHQSCPECEWLAANSPWPKELMVTTPKAGMCSCLTNCRCSLKIVPTTQSEYGSLKQTKPTRTEALRKIKKIKSL